MKFNLILLVIASFFHQNLMAQVPAPPEGQRWVLNEAFSDEFNETSLNENKWYDHHPYWVGRAPAMFIPTTLSFQNGNLEIKNFKFDQDSIWVDPWNGETNTYTMGGGAIVSKSENAHYGFYEVKMKASRIRMSSTFWLKNIWQGGSSNAVCPNSITELDIVEAVGGADAHPDFMNKMKSNTHYIHKECDQDQVWHSEGGDASVGGHVSDDFHVYGAHWQNANGIQFYIDGQPKHFISPSTAESDTPFSRPMAMHMVTETYDWVTPPSTADLNDDNRNTTYYDWVRSYYLLDVNEPLTAATNNFIQNSGLETGDFTNWIGWGGSPREVVSDDHVYSGNYAIHIVGAGAPEQVVLLSPNTTYRLSCYAKVISGEIALGVKETNTEETFLGSIDFGETDYTRKSFEFTTGDEPEVKIYFFAENGEEGYADEFELVQVTNAPEIAMPFEPSLEFYETPIYDFATNTFLSKIEYRASIDRALLIELTNNAGTIVDSKTIPAFAGYGKKSETLPINSQLNNNEAYTLTIQLIPTGNPDVVLATESFAFSSLVTSTENQLLNTPLTIAPNPGRDFLKIAGNNSEAFTIVDQMGRVAKTGVLDTNNTIEILDLTPGLYIISIGTEKETFVKIR